MATKPQQPKSKQKVRPSTGDSAGGWPFPPTENARKKRQRRPQTRYNTRVMIPDVE